MKYRKKPVVIEAEQWNGTYGSMSAIRDYFPKLETVRCSWIEKDNYVEHWHIATLEGRHIVSPGDWIIEGIAGEYYPCKPDIFEVTYEPVEE